MLGHDRTRTQAQPDSKEVRHQPWRAPSSNENGPGKRCAAVVVEQILCLRRRPDRFGCSGLARLAVLGLPPPWWPCSVRRSSSPRAAGAKANEVRVVAAWAPGRLAGPDKQRSVAPSAPLARTTAALGRRDRRSQRSLDVKSRSPYPALGGGARGNAGARCARHRVAALPSAFARLWPLLRAVQEPSTPSLALGARSAPPLCRVRHTQPLDTAARNPQP